MTTSTSVEPDLTNPDLIADPYGGFGRLREEAPILHGRFFDGSPVWLVTRAADVRAVLADPRFVNNVASVPGGAVDDILGRALEKFGVPADLVTYLARNILTVDAPDHTRLRKLVSQTFTVRRVAELRPRVEAITARLLDGLAAAPGTGTVDIVERFGYPLPITVICELVGIPESDRSIWREWSRVLFAMDEATKSGALREMVDYIHGLIGRRRAAPTDDLLSGLIRARDEDGDRLSDEEMVSLVFTLVMAGHETTAHLIGNATLALLTHPDQLDLLRADPGRWPGAVHELMRYCGPVHLTALRFAAADVEVGGTTVRAGEAVQLVLVSANFDPREYDDPERLDITRRPAGRGDGHVGFGYGPHYCLGAALARQEAEVALSMLFARFPEIALVGGPPAWAAVPVFRRLLELPVRLTP